MKFYEYLQIDLQSLCKARHPYKYFSDNDWYCKLLNGHKEEHVYARICNANSLDENWYCVLPFGHTGHHQAWYFSNTVNEKYTFDKYICSW